MNERERAITNTSTSTNATRNGIRAKANVEPRFIVIDAANRMAYFCCLFLYSYSHSHSYSPEREHWICMNALLVCAVFVVTVASTQTGALVLFWCLFHAPKTYYCDSLDHPEYPFYFHQLSPVSVFYTRFALLFASFHLCGYTP